MVCTRRDFLLRHRNRLIGSSHYVSPKFLGKVLEFHPWLDESNRASLNLGLEQPLGHGHYDVGSLRECRVLIMPQARESRPTPTATYLPC